uniref:Uncharacterized protein n=1 Tax=Molossus molossus TaxID=27622 RepID=A0A7J8BYH5_MOLMO|nr:hypothetical protein HJG59_010049 [Molossus molossus]
MSPWAAATEAAPSTTNSRVPLMQIVCYMRRTSQRGAPFSRWDCGDEKAVTCSHDQPCSTQSQGHGKLQIQSFYYESEGAHHSVEKKYIAQLCCRPGGQPATLTLLSGHPKACHKLVFSLFFPYKNKTSPGVERKTLMNIQDQAEVGRV